MTATNSITMATTTTKIRYRIEYAAVKAVIFFINIIPYRLALRIGDFIAFLGYHVFRVRRDVTLSNLRNSFKDRYTSKEYDEIGIMTQKTDPALQNTIFNHNALGQITGYTDRNGPKLPSRNCL